MWDEYLKILKCYPKLYEDLNCGCQEEEIQRVENIVGIRFPEELRSVYLKNDGQKGNTDGIFKAISGYDKYSRPRFLPIASVATAWRNLCNDENLDIFEKTYIPFAIDNEKKMDDVYCINVESGDIYLLWVLIDDPFHPAEWQTNKFLRATSLKEFLLNQINLYG